MLNKTTRTIFSRTVAAGVLFGTLAVASVPAGAFPANGISAQPLALASSDQPELTLVSGGCGPYRHRGPFGGCRPNFVGYRYGYGYRPFGFYRPYGWHRWGGWHRW